MLTRRLRVKVSAAEELVELVHIFVLVCGWCFGWLGVSGVLVLLLFVGERCDFVKRGRSESIYTYNLVDEGLFHGVSELEIDNGLV